MKLTVCGKYETELQYNNYKSAGNTPMFGYNWWKWIPQFRIQKLDNKNTLEFLWLNFWIWF